MDQEVEWVEEPGRKVQGVRKGGEGRDELEGEEWEEQGGQPWGEEGKKLSDGKVRNPSGEERVPDGRTGAVEGEEWVGVDGEEEEQGF